MKRAFTMLTLAAAVLTGTFAAFSQAGEIIKPRRYTPPAIVADKGLDSILITSLEAAFVAFGTKGLKRHEIAATLIDLSEPGKYRSANYNGSAAVYPASVVKLFYLAAIERQIEDGKILITPELERGIRDMIVDSSNEATQYILDVLTETSSGAEMPAKQFEAWQYKRNRVNRWFTSMGYTGINVNQKTFCEDAYGIEQQSRNYSGQNRNMVTTDATARLLAEIVTGNIASPARTREMMSLLKRDPFSKTGNTQASDFIGKALIDEKLVTARIWSKAGWTSNARHDAAYIELAEGAKFIIVIFTENHSDEKDIIAGIAASIISGMKAGRAKE